MTRVVSAIILSALALPALSACQKAAAVDPAAEAAAIDKTEDAMRAAYSSRDAAKLATLYASDATFYGPGERPRVGTGALTEGARRDFSDPAFNLTITTAKTHVSASGDMGYTQGSFNLRYTDPKSKQVVAQSGYYLTVFRKQNDGSWRAVEDMALPAS